MNKPRKWLIAIFAPCSPSTLGEFTPSNVKSVLEWVFRYSLEQTVGLPKHIQEQILYRKRNAKCKYNKCCNSCGCSLPGRFYATKGCDDCSIPPITNEETWNYIKVRL